MIDKDSEVNRLKEIESHLKGKTLIVYWHLLKSGKSLGVREIQRELGMSSPSVASHHLDKLRELGVVEQDSYGRYFLAKTIEVGVLQVFSKVGRFMLPRYSFYAAFFTTLLILYLMISYNSINFSALGFVLVGCGIFWYETVRIWRRRPI
ncbi:winged helix-turn-helix domain-containing protein [Thermoproteota archaeon]